MPKEVYWGRSWDDWATCEYEDLVPGWNVGPQTMHARGWALLPADRHPGGSPNILYVDGSVRADATRRLRRADIPEISARMPAGSEMHLTSWEDYDAVFGTAGHLAPRRKITSSWP